MQGKPCNISGATSASIGTAISGADTHNNEVNNVFYIPVSGGTQKGSLAAYAGFFETTFGGTTWYQTPGTIPGTNSPLYISMGSNFSISPNAPMTTSSFVNVITNALNGPLNTGVASGDKSAVTNFLNGLGGKGDTANVDPCFDGPWDGTSTS